MAYAEMLLKGYPLLGGTRLRQYSREIFDELVKHLGLGKKDLRSKRLVRYLWRRSWEIARHQVDLEMREGILAPRINSVSLWLVDDHVWKPIDATKININGFENIFFTSAAINTHRGWVYLDLEPSKEIHPTPMGVSRSRAL